MSLYHLQSFSWCEESTWEGSSFLLDLTCQSEEWSQSKTTVSGSGSERASEGWGRKSVTCHSWATCSRGKLHLFAVVRLLTALLSGAWIGLKTCQRGSGISMVYCRNSYWWKCCNTSHSTHMAMRCMDTRTHRELERQPTWCWFWQRWQCCDRTEPGNLGLATF